MATDPYPNLLFPTCAECVGIGMAMPDLLWDLEDECGFDALKTFLREHAGRTVCITNKAAKDYASDDIASVMRRLSWVVGVNLKLVIPQGPAAKRARLRWTIYKARKDGFSVSDISRLTGQHERSVWRTLRSLQEIGALSAAPPRPLKGTTPC